MRRYDAVDLICCGKVTVKASASMRILLGMMRERSHVSPDRMLGVRKCSAVVETGHVRTCRWFDVSTSM